jgi:hypothetical protein
MVVVGVLVRGCQLLLAVHRRHHSEQQHGEVT